MRRRSVWWKRMLLAGSLAVGMVLPGCGGTGQYYPLPSPPSYELPGQSGTAVGEAAQPGTATQDGAAQTPNGKPEEGTAPAAPADRQLSGGEIIDCRKELLEKINEERRKNGKPALQLDASLTRAAEARVEQFANGQQGDLYVLLNSFGFSAGYSAEIEAVGSVDPETLVRNWMKTGFQRSILDLGNKQYDKIGIGYVYRNGKSYWKILLTNTNCKLS